MLERLLDEYIRDDEAPAILSASDGSFALTIACNQAVTVWAVERDLPPVHVT